MQYCTVLRGALTPEECATIIGFSQGLGAVDGTLGHTRIRSSIFWLQRTVLGAAWVFDRIRDIADEANRKHWSLDISPQLTAPQLSHYEPGGKYDWHMDLGDGPMSYRKLSVLVQLTPADTGDLEVFAIGALRLGVGDAAVFPSFVMHRAVPALADRWSLASWLLGPRPFE